VERDKKILKKWIFVRNYLRIWSIFRRSTGVSRRSKIDTRCWMLDTRKKFYRGERKSKDDFGGVSLQSDVQYDDRLFC